MTSPKREILAIGERLGFRRAGVARIEPIARRDYFERWLAEGRAGEMGFLHHHKKSRLDPRRRFSWARSMISASFPYDPPAREPVAWREELRGRIAAYALGRDYHREVGDRLSLWAAAIEELVPGSRTRPYIDTGAVLEHEWASSAGVGWTGKHTLTLDRHGGSWGFLGEILVDLELEPDQASEDHCGTCTRCIDICPTDAIRGAYDLDPRRCISYLTIEHKSSIPLSLRPALGEWIFGCDLCQIPCPWNAAGKPDRDLHPQLADLLALDGSSFLRRYGGTAVERTGAVYLRRNAAVVAGNTRNPAILTALSESLKDPSALVREHAVWATGEIDATAARRRSLIEPLRKDRAANVAEEAERVLAEIP